MGGNVENTAFLSDIHGNAVALRAVLEDVLAQGCKRIYVLGDIINGMDPSSCISILKGLDNVSCIKGNAENYMMTPDLDAFPRRDEELYRGLLRVLTWWYERMSPADLDYINTFPDFLHFDGWYMVHDSPLDRVAVKQADLGEIDEKYREILFHGKGIPEDISANELHQILMFMDQKKLSGLFVGHTHLPYIKHVDGKVLCNLGSVGFTLDGDPRPSWILCQKDEAHQNFTKQRAAYEIDQAVHRLLELGFMRDANKRKRSAYIKMLQTGVHWRFHV